MDEAAATTVVWKFCVELETTEAVLNVTSEVAMVSDEMTPDEELVRSLVGLRVLCVLVNADAAVDASVEAKPGLVGDRDDVGFKTEDEEDKAVCNPDVAVPLVREGLNAETLEELLDPDAALEGILSVEEATSLVALIVREAGVELSCVKFEMIEDVGPVVRPLLWVLKAELPCPPDEEVVLS